MTSSAAVLIPLIRIPSWSCSDALYSTSLWGGTVRVKEAAARFTKSGRKRKRLHNRSKENSNEIVDAC